jgi:predicted aldo/keto reductase-like oxidoreductase
MPSKHHLDSIRYEKTLEGVTGMVIGVHSAEQLRENIKLVLEAKPLAKEELAALRERGKEIAAGWEPRFGPVA